MEFLKIFTAGMDFIPFMKVFMACLITIAVIIGPFIISARLNDKEDKCNKEISKKEDKNI